MEDCPESVGMIVTTGLVLGEQGRDPPEIQDAALFDPWLGQPVV